MQYCNHYGGAIKGRILDNSFSLTPAIPTKLCAKCVWFYNVYTNIVKLSPLWEIAQGRVLVQVDDALPLLMLYYFSKSAHKAQGNVFL